MSGLIRRLPLAEMAVATSFFVAALAAIVFARHTGENIMVWPSTAIGTALCIRLPKVRWLAVGIGLFLAGIGADQLGVGDPLPITSALTAVNVVEIVATAWLFRRYLAPLLPVPDVTCGQGAWICGLLAFAIPAFGSYPGGMVVHLAFGEPLGASMLTWTVCSSYGACIFAPPIYLYSKTARERLLNRSMFMGNAAIFIGALGAAYLAICHVRFPFILVGVTLIAASFRLGGFGTACLTTLAGSLVVGLWIAGVQPHGLNVADASVGISALPFFALVATLLTPIAVGLSGDDRRNATRQLAASERRFRESIACAPIGMVLVDLQGAWLATNAAFTGMLGYTEAETMSFGWGQLAHPDEQAAAWRHLKKLIDRKLDRYEAERRYRHKDGTWIWTRVVVSLVNDDHGKPAHFFAQIENLQALRRAEADLSEERNRLRTTLQSITDAVITTDIGGRIAYVNAAAEKLLGQPLQQAMGRRPDEIIVLTDPATGKSTPGTLGRCITHLDVVTRDEPCLLHRPDGDACYVLDTASPVTDAAGRFNGAVIVLRDATESHARARELAHRATHDVLTNLVNRFEFERRARACFERGRLLDRPAVLLMIDLDRFKQVNDQGGHAAGDQMLREVSHTLESAVRDSDTVARLGGDEFAILLDGCQPEQAQAVGEKILRSVHAIDLAWEGLHFAIGASIGAAPLTAGFEDTVAWMAAADGACYESKQAGRGQCRFAASQVALRA